MEYITQYASPIGELLLEADEQGLAGLWINGSERLKSLSETNKNQYVESETPLFEKVRLWLDIYFSGNKPDFSVPLSFKGTGFQKRVWEILCTVDYGNVITYGEIAQIIAEERGIYKMSAQAVGGAVGSNRISIIVPCHRVIGAGGNLTGFGSGIEKKIELLKLESIDVSRFYIPKLRDKSSKKT